MMCIKKLAEQMAEEIEGAREYAICALECRIGDQDLAKTYHNLSQVEYEHAEKLHEFAMQKVEMAKSSGYSYPDSMVERWETKHRCMIEALKDAKVFIDMY